MTADIWATALSVLGPDGLDRLPNGIDAMLIVASDDQYHVIETDGFRKMLEKPLPKNVGP
jgi:thiamine biosynthesis lipoprotein ApbE